MRKSRQQWWIVLWHATYAKHPVVLCQAATARAAVYKAQRQTDSGLLGVTCDELSAVAAGPDYSAAKAEYDRLKRAAEEAQARALGLGRTLRDAMRPAQTCFVGPGFRV